MTLNPLRWLRERRLEAKRTEARAGRTTSGYLRQGERDRAFRNRRKR